MRPSGGDEGVRLRGQVAVVTGAGSGTGAATARHSAADGATVACSGAGVARSESVDAGLRADDGLRVNVAGRGDAVGA